MPLVSPTVPVPPSAQPPYPPPPHPWLPTPLAAWYPLYVLHTKRLFATSPPNVLLPMCALPSLCLQIARLLIKFKCQALAHCSGCGHLCRLLCGVSGLHCTELGTHDRVSGGVLHPRFLPHSRCHCDADRSPCPSAFQHHC